MGNLVVRLISILVGYTFAVIAVALFLAVGYYREVIGVDLSENNEFILFDTVSVGSISLYLMFVIAWAVLLPASVLIAIAELMQWRGITAFLVLGAICALFSAFGITPISDPAEIQNTTLVILLASGFIGGSVYWLVAGRGSGSWMPNRKSS